VNKKVDTPVPQSLEEVAKLYRRISLLLRLIRKEEDAFNEQVEKLKADAERRMQPNQVEALMLAKSVYAFAHKNRAKLTEDEKKKTVEVLGTGSLNWYITPLAVTFDKDTKAEDIIANVKKLNLPQFIRTKDELNKEAMIAEADLANTIDGVLVKQSEKFAIKPIGSELRLEYSINSKRWKIAEPEKKKG
jgi:phage host-nuclease inhibitor protein Gam